MKCKIPQITWHEREPVLSIDFQPIEGDRYRLASGGYDKLVLIWSVTFHDEKGFNIEFHSEYDRHLKPVNVVRFSPSGSLLASGDDDGVLILWRLKDRESGAEEEWFPFKILSGRAKDIYDISWSADGNYLISASTENRAVMWNMQNFQVLHVFSDCKGYVQGCSWDPLNKYLALIGTDRRLKIININSKKTVHNILKAPWSVATDKGVFHGRLFHDDTLKSYFRRLCFTPDGELLIVPSGILEKDDKSINTTYIFSRHSFSEPVAYLPVGDKYTVAVRCSPLLYKLRGSENKENNRSKSLINLPYRMVFAVAANDAVLIYDTEQLVPIACISNIHYAHLTDLSWSADGRILVASSTDGYCSFIIFNENELGEIYVPPPPESPKKEEQVKISPVTPKLHKTEIVAGTDRKSDKEVSYIKTVKPSKSENIVSEKKSVSKAAESPDTAKAKKSMLTTENAPDKKSVTSPKHAAASPVNVKSKKPKLTIESFFKSPKANPQVQESNLETQKDLPEDKANKNNENPEFKEPDLKSTPIKRKETVPMIVVDSALNESCSIEILYESKSAEKASVSKTLQKDPKCKVQLHFANKIKSDDTVSNKISNMDVDDDTAVASFSDSVVILSEKPSDDWKLELSQDEELVPMDTSEPSAGASISKATPEPSAMSSTSEPSSSKLNVEAKQTATTPKPKRRVNLITLSTKTGTPPKL